MGTKLHFIQRKMYENYLLCPEAIHKTLCSLPTFLKENIDIEIIQDYFSRNQIPHDCCLGQNPSNSLSIKEVDGADILKTLFEDISAGKESYNKKLHGLQLTKKILKIHPDHFSEIKTLLLEILQNKATAPTGR